MAQGSGMPLCQGMVSSPVRVAVASRNDRTPASIIPASFSPSRSVIAFKFRALLAARSATSRGQVGSTPRASSEYPSASMARWAAASPAFHSEPGMGTSGSDIDRTTSTAGGMAASRARRAV